MTHVDHLFLFVLFVVQPIYGLISYRRYLARIRAGQSPDRVSMYRWTAITQWIALAALITAWYWLGRPLSDLGFVQAGGTGFYVGVALLLGACGLLLFGWRQSKAMTEDERSEQVQALGDLVHFLPRRTRELHAFFKLSFTAGVVEEIIYRGFLIWYLGLVMPLWAAVVTSSILFALGHSYQGPGGVAKTGLIGLVFGAFYVLTGSIWLPIAGHILLDALQGLTIIEVLREADTSSRRQHHV